MDTKTDLRIQKTYLALHTAFTELLEQTHFEDFTVNELCDRAMIRRATFYKHFADKYEYFTHYIKEIVASFHEQITHDNDENDFNAYLTHMCQQMLLFIKQHKKLVVNVKNSTVFPLLLSLLLEQTRYDAMDALKQTDLGKTLNKNQIEVICAFYAGGISNTLFQCLNQDGSVDEAKFFSLQEIFQVFIEYKYK